MSRKKEHTGKKEKTPPAEESAAPVGEPAAPADAGANELARAKEQLLRLQADFENFRKRVDRERAEVYQRANEDLMTELLQVLDHFEFGLKTAEKHHADKAVLDGFRMVNSQLSATLERFGLRPVDDAEGSDFDPHRHEAVTHMPSDEHPENVVIAQTRRGYLLGDRLLRAAQVVVSSGPQNPPPANEEGAAHGVE